MPGIDEYIMDPKSTAYTDVENAFVEERRARDDRIARAWAYYEGDHELPLEIQADGYDDNVIVNHVEALAEKVVTFLLGDGIAFDAGQPGVEDPADRDVQALWKASRGPILQSNIALSGAIEGHCAVRLRPMAGGYPAIGRLQQAHFSAFWDLFDMQRVVWYRLQYRHGNAGKRIDYVRGRLNEDGKKFDHGLDGWTELTYRPDTQLTGGPLGEESKWIWDEHPAVWPYPWPPVVDWQNSPAPNDYYGRTDVKSAIQLNDALNFILSNVMRIIKHYAAPKTVGIGFSTDELVATQVGGLFTVNKPRGEADLFNLEMQSDLASSMRLAEIITSALWQSGGMVDPQTMKDKIGALTNFGLRVLFQDALKRTQRKQMLYEEALTAITLHGLELAGRPVSAALKVVWSNVLPQDDQAQVTNAQVKLDMGVASKQTIAAELGYDWTREQERMAEEGDNLGSRLLAAFEKGQ
jgi:hypothetical protein